QESANDRLVMGAAQAQLPTVRDLLSNPNPVTPSGMTPLTAAIVGTGEKAPTGSSEVVQLLLDNGADPNHCDLRGETVLMFACRAGKSAIIQALLAKGAEVNLQSPSGDS